jgi:parallel beta-helix repeat protein
VDHNGPYSGVSLVGDSDGNSVRSNTVQNSNVRNEDAAPGDQGNGNCGAPFSRPIQDIGIRVEGPGANNNTVEYNQVSNSAIGGITIHGYVYNPPSGSPDKPNTGNVIRNNNVTDTGKATYTIDFLADGIAVLRQGPPNVVGVSQGNTIANNTVDHSYRNGIFVGNPSQPGAVAGNTVTGNTVTSSRANGIFLPSGSVNNTVSGNTAENNALAAGPAPGLNDPTPYPAYDAKDSNPNCDSNAWTSNVFGTVSQACIH